MRLGLTRFVGSIRNNCVFEWGNLKENIMVIYFARRLKVPWQL